MLEFLKNISSNHIIFLTLIAIILYAFYYHQSTAISSHSNSSFSSPQIGGDEPNKFYDFWQTWSIYIIVGGVALCVCIIIVAVIIWNTGRSKKYEEIYLNKRYDPNASSDNPRSIFYEKHWGEAIENEPVPPPPYVTKFDPTEQKPRFDSPGFDSPGNRDSLRRPNRFAEYMSNLSTESPDITLPPPPY